MRVLIVEDDASKAEQLAAVVTERRPDVSLVNRRSYQSAVKEAMSSEFDLVVLDMSMPTYDVNGPGQGGTIRAFAGRDVLRELKRRGIRVPAVVVTQFDTFADGVARVTLKQLGERLREEFGKQFRGIVYYSAIATNWKDELASMMERKGKE